MFTVSYVKIDGTIHTSSFATVEQADAHVGFLKANAIFIMWTEIICNYDNTITGIAQ